MSLMAVFCNIARIGEAAGKKNEKDGARRTTVDRLQKLTKLPLQPMQRMRMQKMRPHRLSSSWERESKA